MEVPMRNLQCEPMREAIGNRLVTTPNKGRSASARELFFLAAVVACGAIPGWAQTAAPLPDGAGKDTVQKACGSCHALTTITNAGHDRQGWTSVLNMMMTAGAPVPKDQVATVTDYLAKNFPERPAPDAVVVPGSVEVSIKE